LQCKKHGFEFNGQLDFWDMRYYNNLIEETKYSVDKGPIL
jgi:Zn-dependent oligopeptidase